MTKKSRVLMCPPRYYGIFYEINPWMNLKNKSNPSLAEAQWLNLYNLILNTESEIALIEPVLGLPDMVFTANAALVYENQIIISHFRTAQRQKESIHFEDWFEKNGFSILNKKEHYTEAPHFEGAGDALFLGDKLFAGYGYRSQIESYQFQFFRDFELIWCELIDPYFYHLDTCFCPIDSKLAIWFPAAFSAASRRKIENNCEPIVVNEEEAKLFACNAVVLNNYIILPQGCAVLTKDLERKGYEVYSCDMSEFIKSGGACKCLTLIL